jgi:peptidoglycan/xylan/chitin deacetylase (PgdA/CDA1 family)
MGPLARSLSIVAFHRVLPERDPLVPDQICASEFERQLKAIGRWFTVLPLSKAVALLREGTLPVRSACITFDDGYADNATIALPILRRHGMSATFFVATGFLNGGRMWNDTIIEAVRRAQGKTLALDGFALDIATLDSRRSALAQVINALKYRPLKERQERADAVASAVAAPLPSDLMMSSDQVTELLHSGMEIGAHTVNHPILANLPDDRAYAEIRDSKQELENLTGRPVTLFAYPNGKPGTDYLPSHVRMARELKFTAAVSTAWGVATGNTDRHQLPRFTPWDKAPGKFVLRLLHNTFRTNAAAA